MTPRDFSLKTGQAEMPENVAPAENRTTPAKESFRIAEERLWKLFNQSLPCVIYKCNASMELTFISENVVDLLGLTPKELVGTRLLCEKRIIPDDSSVVKRKLADLKKLKSVSMIHRFRDQRGLPVWVAHGLRRLTWEGEEVFHGSLLRIKDDMSASRNGNRAVDRFMHKIGNHFQLLNLAISSLKKSLPETREADVLYETVEKVLVLIRSFSEYNQDPSSWSVVDLHEILESVIDREMPEFLLKGTELKEQIDPSIKQVSLSGDPFLIELAMSHILKNALEATEKGGIVTLHAGTDRREGGSCVVTMKVIDSGCGIEAKNLKQVFLPFFSTKEDHDGLGLNVAKRISEMHLGFLQLQSIEGQGTEVKITLPAVGAGKSAHK
ncbi:MAG: sensor histidine kinase [Candidatus Binatia bacterium]